MLRRDFVTQLFLAAPLAASVKPVKVGLLTDAEERWGAHLNFFLDALARCQYVEQVALSDTQGGNAAKARKVFGARYPDLRSYSNHAEMIREFRPDLAIVTLEAHRAPGPIEQALEGGCHVLAEKPACVRVQDFERLAALADARKRHLMLALATRLYPDVLQARSLIQGGYLGKIYAVKMRFLADQTRLGLPDYQRSWRASKAKAGGGHLMWLGLHYLDVIQFITGQRIEQVSAYTANVGGKPPDVEDAAVVNLRFEGGVLGTLQSAYYLDSGYSNEIVIWGSDGWIRLEPGERLRWYSKRAGKQVNEAVQPGRFALEAYLALTQSAINTCRGMEPPIVTAPEGLQALRIVFAAYRSAQTGMAQAIE
ncbi:MAG: Gfo/Idh/MocA family protein [Bryobacteraceae bacterium]